MKKYIKLPLLVSVGALLPKAVSAHCPLCTVGAGALAVAAASVGISTIVVGIMIGALAMALATWIGKMPKKEYFPYQYYVLALVVFVATIVPIMPLVVEYRPLYVALLGKYGSLLHNTYMVNLFVAGALGGALIMALGPYASRALTKLRGGKQLPYQGVSLTLLFLIAVSLVIELVI